MNARHPLSFLLALAIPFAGVLASASPALAQSGPPAAAAAKARTPIVRDGRFARFALTPHGKIMAVVMQDGTTVHVPGAEPRSTLGALKAGDAIHVEGMAKQTPTGMVIARALVQKDGVVIADGRERRARADRSERKQARAALAPVTATARVAGVLSTPRGKVHALLLDDGTTASGAGLETLGLRVGDRVSVSGKGGTYTQGKAVRIETITLPNGETRTLPKPERHHHRRGAAQGAPV